MIVDTFKMSFRDEALKYVNGMFWRLGQSTRICFTVSESWQDENVGGCCLATYNIV